MNAAPSIFINIDNLCLFAGLPPKSANTAKPDPAPVPACEYRELGGGKAITQKEALAELEGLGAGWRLETPHELFALVDYSQKNEHGAYTRDPMLKDDYYWTSQPTPWCEGGRVVVGFVSGLVYDSLDYYRAFARAVRVSGQ